MKTQDIIALLETLTTAPVVNSRVPTKDQFSGAVDVPFVWIQYRNDIDEPCQTPSAGDQPLGKVYDVECVDATMTGAENLRDQVYAAQGFMGLSGGAYIDGLHVIDQGDDYAPRNAAADSGVFVCSLLFQVMGE